MELQEQQERERKQREASIAVPRDVSEKTARAKSKQYFEQSGLGEMITGLGRLGSHERIEIRNEYGDYHAVDITLFGGDYLRVYTKPDGSIEIIGDISHKTTLSKDKWQGRNGQKELEKALEKAYKHPQSTGGNYDEWSDRTRIHGRGGG